MHIKVAVHLDGPLFKFQNLIMPIVSPVYRTAKSFEIALPSRHSTGLVCEEMDPRLFNGSGLLRFERSLKPSYFEINTLVKFYLSATHQNRTILSEPPDTKIWRLGKTSRVLTKSSWASGVEDVSSLVYSKPLDSLAFCCSKM